jgi:glycosyltransferase involved in cell wall biosynthesis
MLRLALDARMQVGGVGRYSSDLVANLKRMPALDIDVIQSGASFTPWGRWAVKRAVRASAPDVFHSLHLELPKNLGVPAIVTVHDVIPLSHPASMPSSWKRRVFRSLLETTIEEADAIVCPSALTRDELLARGTDRSRVHVIPNGIGNGFSPLSEAEREEARRRFAAGRPYVATLSNDRPHKNAAVLYPVGRVLEAESFRLIGLGAHSGATFIHERLDDRSLRSFLGGAEVFLLPSLVEGFGYPVVESLACGTPTVCGPRVGAVGHLDGGIQVVDVANAREVADALLALLRDDAARDSLTREGLKAAAWLTAARMAEATAALYERTAGSR